jgi:hypothetical protein
MSANERRALARQFNPALQNLAKGVAAGMVAGQEPFSMGTDTLELQAQVFSRVTNLDMKTENSSEGMAGFTVNSSAGVTAFRTCASFTSTGDNVYGGDVSSGVVSLTLYDCDTNEEIVYNGGEVLITIPTPANSEQAAGTAGACQYWDEEANEWSTDGCTFIAFEGPNTVCSCTHLTTFSCAFVPTVTLVNWDVLTIQNIIDYPFGFCFLSTLTLLFCIMAKKGLDNDARLDKIGILQTYEELNGIFRVKKKASHWNKNFRCLATKNCRAAKDDIFMEHSWFSIYSRLPGSSISSFDRIWILYTTLLTGALVAVLFIEATDTLKDQILAPVYQAFICTGIGFILAESFMPTNERFHTLFLGVSEKKYCQEVNKNAVLDQTRLETRDMLGDWLEQEHSIRPGFCGVKHMFTELMINYKMAQDSEPPDFRLSKIEELRVGGFKLVADLVTVEEFQAEWEANSAWYKLKYIPKRKFFGWIFCFLISNFFWIALLTYTLQFEVDPNDEYVDGLGQDWIFNWTFGSFTDLLFSQPMTLVARALVMLWLFHNVVPKPLKNHDAMKTRAQFVNELLEFGEALEILRQGQGKKARRKSAAIVQMSKQQNEADNLDDLLDMGVKQENIDTKDQMKRSKTNFLDEHRNQASAGNTEVEINVDGQTGQKAKKKKNKDGKKDGKKKKKKKKMAETGESIELTEMGAADETAVPSKSAAERKREARLARNDALQNAQEASAPAAVSPRRAKRMNQQLEAVRSNNTMFAPVVVAEEVVLEETHADMHAAEMELLRSMQANKNDEETTDGFDMMDLF